MAAGSKRQNQGQGTRVFPALVFLGAELFEREKSVVIFVLADKGLFPLSDPFAFLIGHKFVFGHLAILVFVHGIKAGGRIGLGLLGFGAVGRGVFLSEGEERNKAERGEEDFFHGSGMDEIPEVSPGAI